MRRKMKLDVGALSVDTFTLDDAPSAGGTVRGHDSDEVALIPTTDWKTCRCTNQPDTCGDLCSNPCPVYTDGCAPPRDPIIIV
ncbi:MAG TPA: hypothetical protein VF092_16655 [Longimicrobium sp.]